MTIFNVYHRTAYRFETENRAEAKFLFVAMVVAENLDKVYELTNHIDHSWMENADVQVTPGTSGHRSTSVGDEIENLSTGERFVVASAGFEKVV